LSILDLRVDVTESGFACGRVLTLMDGGVLCSKVQISQAALKR
jgi:hypothetical protein